MANIFDKSVNRVPLQVIIGLVLLVVFISIGSAYYFTPSYSRVGYQPIQPVDFDHKLHVGQLGMDCRYCHVTVEDSEHSLVPGANTCMNCHSIVLADSPALEPIRQSFETGEPVPWVRIHKTPDYVFFNHAVHVNRGISCVKCHGRVDEMEVVYHAEPLSMSFCLDCHRNPEEHVRPLDKVYDLSWDWSQEVEDEAEAAKQRKFLVEHWKINPPESCSGCHR